MYEELPLRLRIYSFGDMTLFNVTTPPDLQSMPVSRKVLPLTRCTRQERGSCTVYVVDIDTFPEQSPSYFVTRQSLNVYYGRKKCKKNMLPSTDQCFRIRIRIRNHSNITE